MEIDGKYSILGLIPDVLKEHWPEGYSEKVIITPRMLDKNKKKHPDLPENFYEEILPQVIEAPDAVCQNREDERVRIFYKKTGARKSYRAAVLIPKKKRKDDYYPSVLSVRYSLKREFLVEIQERRIWCKESEFGI